jgi:hypothetical protein
MEAIAALLRGEGATVRDHHPLRKSDSLARAFALARALRSGETAVQVVTASAAALARSSSPTRAMS